MNNIEFIFRGKFGDLIRYVCVCQSSFGSITRGFLYTVYMYINNYLRKTYDNILATSYTDLNKQINILFNNY